MEGAVSIVFLGPAGYTRDMVQKPFIPVVIGAVAGLVVIATGALYFFGLSLIPGAGVLQLLVLAATLVILGLLVYVVRQRRQEIKEEDPDDYRKY